MSTPIPVEQKGEQMFIPVVSCTIFKGLNDELRTWLRVEAHNLDPEFGRIVDSEVNWLMAAISAHPPGCRECAARGLPARCVRVGGDQFGLARHPWDTDEFLARTDVDRRDGVNETERQQPAILPARFPTLHRSTFDAGCSKPIEVVTSCFK